MDFRYKGLFTNTLNEFSRQKLIELTFEFSFKITWMWRLICSSKIYLSEAFISRPFSFL